ncbi:unnamed protein product [Vicia faba]|uniref:Uncharacterized protein n=1 Tax=Vicia faba TaxID=3906 RepID=A0AAV0ZZ62_VICFA|nr:unnamed protein product [Vicia faba]
MVTNELRWLLKEGTCDDDVEMAVTVRRRFQVKGSMRDLLKEIEKKAKNFIWSGVISKRKLVLVAWDKMCRSQAHGGLGQSSNIKCTTSSSTDDFKILKALDIVVKPHRAHVIKEVLWLPPPIGWTKYNYDDAYQYNSLPVGCGGIFRDHLSNFVLNKVSLSPSYLVEFTVVVNATMIAMDKG